MLRRDGPPIGRTFAATVALALILSVLPLPEALRPFAKLRETPKDTLARLVWPHRAGPVAQPPPPELDAIVLAPQEEEAAEPEAMVFEPLDLTTTATAPPEPRRARRDDEARKWDVLLERVQAKHVALVDPCLDAACRTTALTPWFEALDAIGAESPSPVRLVTLGTSLIASDHITDVLRRRLQNRYGDAGAGFLFVDRPTRNAGRTVRSGTATEGWLIEKVTDAPPLTNGGLGGVAFTAPADAPQDTNYLASGARHLELFAVTQRGAGVVHVHVKDSVSRPSARHPYTYVLPGDGEFPAAPLFAELRAGGFDGPVSLEWERMWHPYLPPLDEALRVAGARGWW